MSRYFSFLMLFIFSASLYSVNVRKLSESARISLITCSPGDELYSIFGHSAIRVFDDSQHINEVYNYGTFDFDTPNFYLKFASGKLDYMLSAYNFKYFLPAYYRDGRGVTEQMLNLTQVEKQRLYEALEINRLPENKFYRYDFFFDNCATRIRDIVFTSVNGRLRYNKNDTLNMTFRDMLHLYLDRQPWTRDGIDIILGSRIDRKVTMYESMFLPDYLKEYFMNTYIVDTKSNDPRPLVKSDITLLKPRNNNTKVTNITPELIAWGLFMILFIVSMYEVWSGRKFFIIERVLLLVTGLLGIVVFYLWFLTEHTATGANYNILWAMPTNLILMFGIKKITDKGFWRILGIITIISLSVVSLLWKYLPQSMPPMAFPLALIMFLRISKIIFPKNKRF
ncbi:MAG: DUF4105 domain-containing protein [Chlorobi bacterium]|nr:DUF4105 domain-containing protein [Chlorobiota bacterium]